MVDLDVAPDAQSDIVVAAGRLHEIEECTLVEGVLLTSSFTSTRHGNSGDLVGSLYGWRVTSPAAKISFLPAA
jgi:hypothetical protein